MTPPSKIPWIQGLIMAVVWTVAASFLGSILIVSLGRDSELARDLLMLIVDATVVAVLCAHSYREGWKRGRDDHRLLQSAGSKEQAAA